MQVKSRRLFSFSRSELDRLEHLFDGRPVLSAQRRAVNFQGGPAARVLAVKNRLLDVETGKVARSTLGGQRRAPDHAVAAGDDDLVFRIVLAVLGFAEIVRIKAEIVLKMKRPADDFADRVVVLVSGEMIANGAPAAILQDANVIRQYLGAVRATSR